MTKLSNSLSQTTFDKLPETYECSSCETFIK